MTKVESGYTVEPGAHVQPESRHLEAPLLRLDLAQEIAALRQLRDKQAQGHGSKTLAKYPDLRLVLMTFEPGAKLAEHQTKGRVSVHVLEGEIALVLEGQRVTLGAGCLLEIAPNIPHDVEALAPSAMLLTIAWPPAAGR